MKLSRIAMLGAGLSALIFGAVVLTPSDANAACPPGSPAGATCGNTTGTAGGGSGNSSVFNIADLKTNGQGGPLICTPAGPGPYTSCNYDDDPSPNADNHFNVVPNLDDSPLQYAAKYVFINNPTGVTQVEKTISAVMADGGRTLVFHDLQPAANIKSGQACLDLLGADNTIGTVANGLITTGQKTAAELLSVRNGCQQNTIGVLTNPFPVSKHLPPGIYEQCAVLATSGGGATTPFCEQFKILPITGYQTDVNTVNYGTLVQGTKSIWGGNFVMDTTLNPAPGTIQGIGNTSPKVLVAYSCMANDYLHTSATADDKLICSYFDIQLNRQDVNGNIVATQRVDNIVGGAHPASANPFGADYDTTLGTTTGTLVPICLEPNENIKVDFSVTPQEVLYPGTYAGLVRLTVTNTNVPTFCTPTLAASEQASGDTDSVYNNLPGALVAQSYAP